MIFDEIPNFQYLLGVMVAGPVMALVHPLSDRLVSVAAASRPVGLVYVFGTKWWLPFTALPDPVNFVQVSFGWDDEVVSTKTRWPEFAALIAPPPVTLYVVTVASAAIGMMAIAAIPALATAATSAIRLLLICKTFPFDGDPQPDRLRPGGW